MRQTASGIVRSILSSGNSKPQPNQSRNTSRSSGSPRRIRSENRSQETIAIPYASGQTPP
jgi:hypothetical protein